MGGVPENTNMLVSMFYIKNWMNIINLDTYFFFTYESLRGASRRFNKEEHFSWRVDFSLISEKKFKKKGDKKKKKNGWLDERT